MHPLIGCPSELDAIDESLEIGWIAFRSSLHLDFARVGRVLEKIDRIAYLAQVLPQFRFFSTLHGDTRQRQNRGGEYQQNRACDHKFEERHARRDGSSPPLPAGR